ncbi:phospholipid/cholesterol/gamma-HCH transport system substrate-binding protein [Pseudonocardia thermophila]|uniref:Phospholipid/cholesterol/gamma-HCH transport system substrate-binding protein n=1 Tax=Pseudonocardia thermophila TaxID=1848 RepID=A0A1M6X820_PSETH|nr:MCE family protein [Pseudonocardia thermophila]SHL02066.1 phospholipid/cholesterol/gamma-HCH transport system substrate-binding protein [Pseudonocardia thermophila]
MTDPITHRLPPVPTAVGGVLAILLVVLLAFNGKALFSGGTTYTAYFTDAAGLQAGDQVTIAGVEVGRVTDVSLVDGQVVVDFRVHDAWIGDRTIASIEIRTLLGAKYLALDPQGEREQDPDHPWGVDRTVTPFDVVEAFDGLSETIDAIDTEQLAQSLQTLSDTFRGTAPEIRGALDGLSRLSTTIASRDEQLRTLLSGTRTVATTLAERRDDIEALLSDGNLLLAELQARRDAIAKLITGIRDLSRQLSGLVADNIDQLRPTLETLDEVVAVLERNQDNLVQLLKKEAVFIRVFNNAIGTGRWFDNYICGLLPVPALGPLNPGGCDLS